LNQSSLSLTLSQIPDWDWPAFLESLGHFGVDLSLERMQVLLQRLGQPQAGIPAIHVAGTNGKGSVCAWVSHVLWAAGYRVGRYTSPHLVDWRERIWMNGEYISANDWSQALAQVRDCLQTYAPDEASPTQFEVITAAAWLYFRRQKVDVIPAVCAPQTPEVTAVIQAKAEQLQSPLRVVDPLQWSEPQTAHWRGQLLTLPLSGDVQLTNAAVALAVVETLQQQGWRIPDAAVEKGFAITRWPGRLQRVQIGSRQLLMDGAHNLPAAQALRRYLDKYQPGPLTWYMGILTTKDVQGILSTLLRPGDCFFALPIAGHSGTDPEQLAQLAQTLQPHLASARALPNLSALRAQLLKPKNLTEPPAVICGSLYLLGQVMQECLGWDLAC
jgi:dihydrofolate synthase/folylpolyglutamate synthase